MGALLAHRAVELGKDDAVALTRGGHALAHLVGDLDGGIALIDKALVLNPNLAAAWFLGGYLRLWRGDAIERLAHAMRVRPLDPEMYRMRAGTAMGHFLAGHNGFQSFDQKNLWHSRTVFEMQGCRSDRSGIAPPLRQLPDPLEMPIQPRSWPSSKQAKGTKAT